MVVGVVVVPIVEREVEDLGAALPAQAPRHGGRALRIKLWMRRAGLRLGCRKMERCEDGDVESSRVETREGGCPGGGRERREEGGGVCVPAFVLGLFGFVSVEFLGLFVFFVGGLRLTSIQNPRRLYSTAVQAGPPASVSCKKFCDGFVLGRDPLVKRSTF